MKIGKENVLDFIKLKSIKPSWLGSAIKYNNELLAIVSGVEFLELLISKIEGVESPQKANIRKKYSRAIKDFYERLFAPIDNVFSATGGVKEFHIKNETDLKTFINKLSKIKGGQSLETYIQDVFIPLLNIDPNGLIFLEYTTDENEVKAYPTYKNISSIRNYELNGQKCEYVLFNPIQNNDLKIWRLVDDEFDYEIIEKNNEFTINEENTTLNEVLKCPAVVISNIKHVKENYRISPIDSIIELSKEYARDQSIKTLSKKINGFSTPWRVVSTCKSCNGSKKSTDGSECGECNGYGYYKGKDVTDVITIDKPRANEPNILPNIAGHISPPMDYLQYINKELDWLENKANLTHWGTSTFEESNKTATGKFIDVQPKINRLYRYSRSAEYMEWRLTEMLGNLFINSHDGESNISTIHYGYNYIVEPLSVLVEKYTTARKENIATTILDRQLKEIITSKFKNDIEQLRVELLKSTVEPYVHMTIKEVFDYVGQEQAIKKASFTEWWSQLTYNDLQLNSTQLITKFNKNE